MVHLPEYVVSILVENATIARNSRNSKALAEGMDKTEVIVHNSNMSRVDEAIRIAEREMYRNSLTAAEMSNKAESIREKEDDYADWTRSKEAFIEGRR